MSILALLGVVFSSAAMIIVLSGFSGLKNYSLEFLSYASPDLEISSKKGKRFVLDENIKNVLSDASIDYVKCISERAVMSINGGKKIITIKSLDKNFSKRNVDSILYAGSWPKKVEEVVVGWGLAVETRSAAYEATADAAGAAGDDSVSAGSLSNRVLLPHGCGHEGHAGARVGERFGAGGGLLQPLRRDPVVAMPEHPLRPGAGRGAAREVRRTLGARRACAQIPQELEYAQNSKAS